AEDRKHCENRGAHGPDHFAKRLEKVGEVVVVGGVVGTRGSRLGAVTSTGKKPKAEKGRDWQKKRCGTNEYNKICRHYLTQARPAWCSLSAWGARALFCFVFQRGTEHFQDCHAAFRISLDRGDLFAEPGLWSTTR